jgi:outer membrane protein OmpA-like peptidoglycan-associated protein
MKKQLNLSAKKSATKSINTLKTFSKFYSGEVDDISLKRAKTVYNFLLSNGISADRITYKGFASSRPIYPLPEKNEEERVANRRVEILIIEK